MTMAEMLRAYGHVEGVPPVIIEVAETHPPKTGKKLGTVKTAAGESFGIWPDKLSALRVGSRYQIEFDENEFNGRTYRKITKVHAAEAAPPAPRAAHCAAEICRRRTAICLFTTECGHCGGDFTDSD